MSRPSRDRNQNFNQNQNYPQRKNERFPPQGDHRTAGQFPPHGNMGPGQDGYGGPNMNFNPGGPGPGGDMPYWQDNSGYMNYPSQGTQGYGPGPPPQGPPGSYNRYNQPGPSAIPGNYPHGPPMHGPPMQGPPPGPPMQGPPGQGSSGPGPWFKDQDFRQQSNFPGPDAMYQGQPDTYAPHSMPNEHHDVQYPPAPPHGFHYQTGHGPPERQPGQYEDGGWQEYSKPRHGMQNRSEREQSPYDKWDSRRQDRASFSSRPRYSDRERKDTQGSRPGRDDGRRHGRHSDRESRRDSDRGSGRDSDRGSRSDRDSSRFSERGSSRYSDRVSPRESHRRSGRESERGSAQDSDRGSERSYSVDRKSRHHRRPERSHSRSRTDSERRSSKRPRSSTRKDESTSSVSDSSPRGRDSLRSRRAVSVGDIIEDEDEDEKEELPDIPAWQRASPAELYFEKDEHGNLITTKRMQELEDKFEQDVVQRASKVRAVKPKIEKPVRKVAHLHRCGAESESSSSSSDSDDDGDNDGVDGAIAEQEQWLEEMKRKKDHPERINPELWFNEEGEMNDGPVCKCSAKSRQKGIRHSIFHGEKAESRCNPESNNLDRLHHYRVTISPHTNFLTREPTIIEHDEHEYIFEGFSIFSHTKLENVPVCKVTRFSIDYTIHFFEEKLPENFSIRSLDMFTDFLFFELLELLDLDWKTKDEESCRHFHIMPRFVRSLPENGKEILSMNEVLRYLLDSSELLVTKSEMDSLIDFTQAEWQTKVSKVKGMIVTCPGMRPGGIRVDQLDRTQSKDDNYPLIVHFGFRPVQLSYVGDKNYVRLWREYVKFRHLLANKPKVTLRDKQSLQAKVDRLMELRSKSSTKREVTVEISSKDFYTTGIRSDVCQHALLLPVLIRHLRFHRSLEHLEGYMEYKFKDRSILQLALTHPSYSYINYGTNPDHCRNSLAACGLRQAEYGYNQQQAMGRKRGINTLINIMSRMGCQKETKSKIQNNERLEFLGDAVVEFVTSVHLFFMFPNIEEGGLATYRAALVQNQHLAVLAKKLHLEDFMLFAHGPELCRESELRHAMANCFEALMGAVFYDGSLEDADRIFAKTLYGDDKELHKTWTNLPLHTLQEEEPNGDRHWIEYSGTLKKLTKLEDQMGIEFDHIRLLARSLTLRRVGYNNLTLGDNQRLEFLGDTILQMVATEHLFLHFPTHHEGHLSLLRSSLVNHHTQSRVCQELGILDYVIIGKNPREDKVRTIKRDKEKADILEAFLGALYVDKGLEYCKTFCRVCFFPRLTHFIMSQEWNDPKSQLQQCCLTLREMGQQTPDRPIYKIIGISGPTNTRVFSVAVYFRGEKLAKGQGNSIQEAQMIAAAAALENRKDMFPQFEFQKQFISQKYQQNQESPKKEKKKRKEKVKTPEKDEEQDKQPKVFNSYLSFIEDRVFDKLAMKKGNKKEAQKPDNDDDDDDDGDDEGKVEKEPDENIDEENKNKRVKTDTEDLGMPQDGEGSDEETLTNMEVDSD